jgi:hypothetical protein
MICSPAHSTLRVEKTYHQPPIRSANGRCAIFWFLPKTPRHQPRSVLFFVGIVSKSPSVFDLELFIVVMLASELMSSLSVLFTCLSQSDILGVLISCVPIACSNGLAWKVSQLTWSGNGLCQSLLRFVRRNKELSLGGETRSFDRRD